MALAPRLELRQGQGLVMTPQLQQAIKLLTMANHELADYVEMELERNPLLERDDRPDGAGSPDEPDFEPVSDSPIREMSASDDGPNPDAEASLDVRYDDLYNDATPADVPTMADTGGGSVTDWSKTSSGGSGDDLDSLESTLTRDKTLHEHLEMQIALALQTPSERLIGAHLVDQVDEAGYMRGDMAEIAQRLGTDEAEVERVLTIMHGFEPTGVMARSVSECLGLQLAERNRLDPAMQAMLDNLPLLAKRDLITLREVCAVDGEDLADMIAEIRSLNPKPGAAFGADPAPSVVPDVFIREAPNGAWAVELNSDNLPRVLMNQRYYAEVTRGARQETEKAWIAECAQTASWLVKSLDQRARTILKVTREIVRQQDGFLTYGVSHLRPLNLKSIATVIDMHESTVSRVTSNKYVSTPRGTFELKYFFTASIQSTDGSEAHSAVSVRYRIKELIDGERGTNPLSDDRIVEMLREAGVEIARRTVAKYREALHIPSSVERRRSMSNGR